MEGEEQILTKTHLEGLKRKDLLSLCKDRGIKCSGKNEDLIESSAFEDKPEMSTKDELIYPQEVMSPKRSRPLETIDNFTPIEMTPIAEIQTKAISLTPAKSPITKPTTKKPFTNQPEKSTTAIIRKTKPKFDLKESLKRPLSYKPHTGPLKPFKL